MDKKLEEKLNRIIALLEEINTIPKQITFKDREFIYMKPKCNCKNFTFNGCVCPVHG